MVQNCYRPRTLPLCFTRIWHIIQATCFNSLSRLTLPLLEQAASTQSAMAPISRPGLDPPTIPSHSGPFMRAPREIRDNIYRFLLLTKHTQQICPPSRRASFTTRMLGYVMANLIRSIEQVTSRIGSILRFFSLADRYTMKLATYSTWKTFSSASIPSWQDHIHIGIV